jgi:hypothetical protein
MNFWEGYGGMEIAGELRGNHSVYYFRMLPVSNNESWHAPETSVRTYLS